jgi:hypothetical protein
LNSHSLDCLPGPFLSDGFSDSSARQLEHFHPFSPISHFEQSVHPSEFPNHSFFPPLVSPSDGLNFFSHGPELDAQPPTNDSDSFTTAPVQYEGNAYEGSRIDTILPGSFDRPLSSFGFPDFTVQLSCTTGGSSALPADMYLGWNGTDNSASSKACRDSITPSDHLSGTPCS